MQLYLLLKFIVVGFGLLLGLLLASGVDQLLGWYGLVALASLAFLMTALLSMA